MRLTLVVCGAFFLLAAGCNMEESKTHPPIFNGMNTIADVIKYLQELDLYFGDKARIRFGKRGFLMQTLRNRMPENAIGSSNNNIAFISGNNAGELMYAAGHDMY